MREPLRFTKPRIAAHAHGFGPKEAQGPLGQWFDLTWEDDTLGQETFELAEREMFRQVVDRALANGALKSEQIDLMLGGDLLNQMITASFCARDLAMPFIGIYSACATVAGSLLTASCLIEGGMVERVLAGTASHFSTAERQYRTPLELGGQRAPTAQRTATAAGAFVVGNSGDIRIAAGTYGRVIDYGVADANNMGATMAPAVADTIEQHLRGMGRQPGDYDAIFTGDLGTIGSRLLVELLEQKGIDIKAKHHDCGAMLFSQEQGTDAGGSGCGCVAGVLSALILRRLTQGEYKRVLVVPCGALLSVTSMMQGESIPGIAHAIELEGGQAR